MHKNKKTIKISPAHLLACLSSKQIRPTLHNLIPLRSG
jgi:hypothetical protein